MDEKIFERVEKKYLITSEQYQRILAASEDYLKKDAYHQSDIFNIYFDNDNYDLIIQSIDRPIFKEKLRARSYAGYDKVFLEIKTKLDGSLIEDQHDNNIGYKRRVLITHKDYDRFIAKKSDLVKLAKKHQECGSDVQIAHEIDYMIDHFNLKPQILVYYHRESYRNNDGLRITFDSDIKYRTKTLKFNKNSRDRTYFHDDKCIIMEIKAPGYMPLWLVKVLSSEHIYPTQFSKIGKIYETIMRKEKNV